MHTMTKQEWVQRQEDIQVIADYGFDYAVTFNTRKLIPQTHLREMVLEFERRLNRKLFGTNWRKTGTRLQWVHNYEHTSGNSHAHSVCKLCEGVDATKFKRQARHIWGKLTTGNNEAQLWIDKIKNQTAVAAYVLKGGSTDYTHA